MEAKKSDICDIRSQIKLRKWKRVFVINDVNNLRYNKVYFIVMIIEDITRRAVHR